MDVYGLLKVSRYKVNLSGLRMLPSLPRSLFMAQAGGRELLCLAKGFEFLRIGSNREKAGDLPEKMLMWFIE